MHIAADDLEVGMFVALETSESLEFVFDYEEMKRREMRRTLAGKPLYIRAISLPFVSCLLPPQKREYQEGFVHGAIVAIDIREESFIAVSCDYAKSFFNLDPSRPIVVDSQPAKARPPRSRGKAKSK